MPVVTEELQVGSVQAGKSGTTGIDLGSLSVGAPEVDMSGGGFLGGFGGTFVPETESGFDQPLSEIGASSVPEIESNFDQPLSDIGASRVAETESSADIESFSLEGGLVSPSVESEQSESFSLEVSKPVTSKPVVKTFPAKTNSMPTLDELKRVELFVKSNVSCTTVDEVAKSTGLSNQYVILCLEYLNSLGILPKDTVGRYCGLSAIKRLQEQLVQCKKCVE